jgi:hypothetical protein
MMPLALRRAVREPEFVVVGARQAPPAARINSLIHADICLSPAGDSKPGGENMHTQQCSQGLLCTVRVRLKVRVFPSAKR